MDWITDISIGHIPNHTRLAAAMGLLVQAIVWFYLYFSKRNVLKGALPILVFAMFAAADFLLKTTILLRVQQHWISQVLYYGVTLLSVSMILNTWGMVKVCKFFHTPKQVDKEMQAIKQRLMAFQAAMIKVNRFDGLTKQFADLEHSFKRLEETINADETIRREPDLPDTWTVYPVADDPRVHPRP